MLSVNKKVVINRKATRTPSCTGDQPDEYATFESALKKVLAVSHKQMQKRINRASAGRASNAKD
jgi:hypothetical protein